MIATILDILGGFGGAIAALTTLSTTIFAVLWRRSESKRKDAETKARTHEEMRDHEREASQMDDTSLADRITRDR